MSTLEIDGLTQLLETLSVSAPAAKFKESHILINPLDICRSSLAELLSSLVECNIQDAYKSIQWPNNIWNGDLSVTLPRLRPGCKPAELSTELIDKVRRSLVNITSEMLNDCASSRKITPFSTRPYPKASISVSFSSSKPSHDSYFHIS